MTTIAQIFAAVEAEMANPAVHFAMGRRSRNKNDRPPRVSAIPIGGAIEPTDTIGRRDYAPGKSSKQRYRRDLEVRVECWGTTPLQAEELYLNTLITLRMVLGFNFQPSTEEWVHEQEDVADDVIRGSVIAFQGVIQLDTLDIIIPLSHVDTITHHGFFVPSKAAIYGYEGIKYGDAGLLYGPSEEVC